MPSPSFADDIALLALYPDISHGHVLQHSTKWRYEFNHTKSDVVTYGETKPVHFEELREREWILRDGAVDELYEYKNLGVLKNYIGSFSSIVEDNIDKARKKAGMIFSSNSDRRKVNPFMYIKFWSQACLPSQLYGSELFTLTSSLLAKLERCQKWFLKNIFYEPNFAPIRLILKLSGLNSIESEIALRKLLFLGRMITENKLTPTVRNLFRYRVDSFFDENISSLGLLPSICEALHRYELFDYFESWFHNSTFPNYSSWKTIVKNKINKYEENALSHPNFHIAQECLENVPPCMFWAIADIYPDLVARRHVQVTLMGNFGLDGGIPWLAETDGSL